MLRIELLGHFQLVHQGTPITRLTRPRLRALLVYLLLNRRHLLPRQRVAFNFWPETKESQSHSNLRNLLTKLHRAAPELAPFLQIDEHVIGWRGGTSFSLDVADFEAALQQAERANQQHDENMLITALEKAVELYSGELLPDLYDDWVLAMRQRLQDDFFYALEWLIQLLKTRTAYGAALRYARIYVEREPLSEVAYRHLIELHALNGDRASTVRAYQRCRDYLRQELGSDPSPATQTLYGHMLAATPPGAVGNTGRGLTYLLTAWAGFTAHGAKPFPGVLHFLTQFATVLAKQGRVDEAFALLDQGGVYLSAPGEALWEAELHRLRGRLLWQQGESAPGVEPYYQRALAVAQAHKAHGFALRAAADLCALWQGQPQAHAAQQQLLTLCRYFTPGLKPDEVGDLWAALAEF